ncbi:aspartate--tRNA ligase [Candidatus Woesebacteria bacterium]|nr:aspartate--tRNA ligase [Candidatus Woesebacteria bacterium]
MKKYSVIDTLQLVGQEVELYGWVDSKRDHKKVIFIDLRDRTGKIQAVGTELLRELSPEDVVKVTGLIKERPERLVNPNIATGTIEMEITAFEILGKAETSPIPLDTAGYDIDEELRLKYRYLDLRRDRMARTIKLRSDYIAALRSELSKKAFTEVETPILTKSTKEGARDFLVPARQHPGKFYALPQSPQQYKQLLMVAGVEKYFQFARCIRDEDLRADRGFEHTQLDLEMSFVDRDDVMNTVEEMVTSAIHAVGGKLQKEPFPVFTYQEALEKFGADKFDLRTDEEKKDGTLAFAWVVNFPFFKKVDAADKAEVADGKSGWTFTHNPFSMPLPEHLEWHMKGENIDQIMTTQYDLVCNGFEAGGGSIRAHKPEILEATYKIMGYTPKETQESVGHMIDAFKFGTPPHGGIALGIDRHVMVLAQEKSLKEAIAFPMSSSGKTAVMDAPSPVDQKQLAELGISVDNKE